MEYELLKQVNSPEELKKLTLLDLKRYAYELRAYITQTVLRQGGHLASSLGAVEIALALHYVFNAPHDKIIFDVGHQAYAHKIITGRRGAFKDLRTDSGVTGFPNREESAYDAFTAGHASASLSAALGYCRARAMENSDYKVVAVIGDGALTGGMAFEALNDIGASGQSMVIILNDNDMSIRKNTGALNRYFSRLRISKGYLAFKASVKKAVSALPFFGNKMIKLLDKCKSAMRAVFRTNKMFEQMGIRYYGPFDGNNAEDLIGVLGQAKNFKGPVLVHLLTQKGCGFSDAEKDPTAFHGLNPVASTPEHNFGEIAGDALCSLAQTDSRICAITAAMPDGTGLLGFMEKFPSRCFDVAIAEQHAVTLAAGLAAGGQKPYVAVYSSFLQRGFDQIIHDTALNNLPVTFLIDRAGVIGADGVTHQGVFDISYLNLIPNLTILTPKDGQELREMVQFSQGFNAPLAIRYPKGFTQNYTSAEPFTLGKWEVIASAPKQAKPVYLLAAGSRMLQIALQTHGATVVNARCIKPLDTQFLESAAKNGATPTTLITLEDNVLQGGFGASVLAYINARNLSAKVITLGLKDQFIRTHSIQQAFTDNALTPQNLQSLIK
ncbi:MAG: 1-deoxy-D-xylulose-5-phosphate synthase [Firmicutes bacterium]|nr:1-deoxy-D-xylulose-5-phosphate synthase [Bacillota bacterium]